MELKVRSSKILLAKISTGLALIIYFVSMGVGAVVSDLKTSLKIEQLSKTEEAGLNELLANEIIVLTSIDQNFTLDLTGLASAQKLQERQGLYFNQIKPASAFKKAPRFENSK